MSENEKCEICDLPHEEHRLELCISTAKIRMAAMASRLNELQRIVDRVNRGLGVVTVRDERVPLTREITSEDRDVRKDPGRLGYCEALCWRVGNTLLVHPDRWEEFWIFILDIGGADVHSGELDEASPDLDAILRSPAVRRYLDIQLDHGAASLPAPRPNGAEDPRMQFIMNMMRDANRR